MPKDYMAPGEDSSGSPENGDNKPEQSPENSALLPKSFFGGESAEVGSTLSVKVVAIHGDEVEVAFDDGKKQDDEENQGEDSESMKGAMGKIDSLAA